MRQKIHTLTRTISMQSVCLLWHYNPLKNITYHRIMNAIKTLFFIFFWNKTRMNYRSCTHMSIQSRKRDSLQKANPMLRELLVSTLIMVSWY
jgi:hypothetical protein